jgi:hypothetical protein
MVKLFLSTPCYGGVCLEEYAKSIINLQLKLINAGIEFYIDTTENESLVHRARNVSVGRFMRKKDYDYFMFIDADIHFDPESVISLINSDHDLSVACYPKKYILWDKVSNITDPRKAALNSTELVVNINKDNNEVVNGFVEVLDGPTGFMLIKRKVFEQMEEKFPELLCKNDHSIRDFDHYYALFDCMIDPDSKRYLSEDYAFCRRWQQIGGKIYADTNTILGHVGNLSFTGCLEDRITTK